MKPVKEDKFKEYQEAVRDIKKFSEAPSCGENPFIYKLAENMSIQRKVIHAENRMASVDIIDRATGEVTSGAEENRVFVKRQQVDDQRFVKIYADRIKMMFNLSHSAYKVFGFFLHEMQKAENKERDKLYFDLKSCMDFCGYDTHAMVYRGLTELISHTFIAKAETPPNHYFVDANAAFNGNRIIIMEEYNRKSDDYFNDKSLGE